MSLDYISNEVKDLIKKYDETDPERLCKALDIHVKRKSFGTAPDCFKGLFLYNRRIKCIVINDDLPEPMQKVVLAHELGHCVLHLKSMPIASFNDISLFDNTRLQEYEANIFASELLLPDEKVLEVLNEDSFFSEAASKLHVPQEMLDFKFRVLKRKGFKVNSPITASANFLKSYQDGGISYDFC